MDRADDLSSFSKLEGEFYAGLPRGKYLAGRRRCRELAEMVVQEFRPGDSLDALKAEVRSKAKEKYGSILLLILLPIIGELARAFIQWWIQNHWNQALAIRWRDEFFEQARCR